MAFVAAGIAMGAGTIASGALGFIGAGEQADAARAAAEEQAAAARYAADLQYKEYNQTREDLAPYRDAGTNALGMMQGPEWQKPVSNDDIMKYMDPSYNFRMQQGLDAINASAAARGEQFNGNTMKGILDYSQGLASTEYGNAFNRFTTDQNNRFGRLSNLASLGQFGAGTTAQAGANYSTNVGNDVMGGANAAAAGRIGAAQAGAAGLNSIGSSLSNLGNNWMQMSMMNKLIDTMGKRG